MDVWTTINGEILKQKTNITSIPDSSINVHSTTYKCMSSVSLISSTRPYCHYMAILSAKEKWVHFKDPSPCIAPWPLGGKDVLLLFYHAKSTVASVTSGAAKDIDRKIAGHSSTPPLRTVFARTQATRTTTAVSIITTTTTTRISTAARTYTSTI